MEATAARSGRGLWEGLYRVLMRRNSVYVTFVVAGAFVGERNRGRQDATRYALEMRENLWRSAGNRLPHTRLSFHNLDSWTGTKRAE
ncbi:hypothetical protein KSP39_PZI020871 [Platanthera zijinensis]|uniref:Uncharacterized protein n=1 Tax=Platanthera zijinensis TaxID=2320716 RepID=A0AAP0FXC3_9ASPA